MKNSILQTIKSIMADRRYFSLMTAVFVGSILFTLYVLFSIEQRDIQVITQYSAFGESHFYKQKWYYLYNFAALGLIIAVAHTAIMIKLYNYERRTLGGLFGWLTLLLLVIATLYVYRVLQVAYL